MIWIFAVVTVALVAIIVQLLLLYQKRVHELRLRQEPIHRRIREHRRNMEEVTQKIRQTAGERLEELEFVAGEFKKQSEAVGKKLSHWQKESLGKAEEGGVEERPVSAAGKEGRGGEGEIPGRRERLDEVIRMREQMDSQVASLRRELEIVRRMLEHIESRVESRSGRQAAEEKR